MNLKTYIYPLRRWWWLIAAATIVAAVSSFLVALTQPPVYESRVTLMMGRAMQDPNPSANEFWLGQQLAGTYADFANRDQVRNATMQALGVTWLPSYRARALNESQLIEISVVDTIPERAQLVANELARQLILITPTSEDQSAQSRQEFINQQLDTLEEQIQETKANIEQLQADLGNLFSARQIQDTQNQIAALQGKLSTLQANYADLYANTERGAINTLTVIEPAGLPKRPVGPQKELAVAVAAAIGFSLAAGAAYLLEYLDDSLKTPQDIERVLGYPVIGYMQDVEDEKLEQPFVAKKPRHPISEAFRSLRTNLEFAAVDQPLKTILVSSADAGEGKSSIAVNLAVAMSQSDNKVVLVDADLRLPDIHSFMGMTNEIGLTDVFRGRVSLQNALRLWRDGKVAVVTSGSVPPNPAELLGSNRMNQILTSLKEAADKVIIDGPPFVVTDAAVLAAKVDGVVLVIRPGFTRRPAAEAMVDQIRRSGARVIGIVLNRIPNKLSSYYSGQVYANAYYNSPYLQDENRTPARGLKKWQESAGNISSARRATESNVKPTPVTTPTEVNKSTPK